MISIELLEAIRTNDYKVLAIDVDKEDNKIGYLLSNKQWYWINIYELAHKCKEWAILNGGYNIWSSGYGKECYIDGRRFKEFENIRFLAASEPEAIFKACEWILEQIKNKKD